MWGERPHNLRQPYPGGVPAPPTRIAVAALVREGRVLLAHRHPRRRWYPDCWDLVGGHIEDGESPLDAVVRECAEEIGVVVDDPTPFDVTIDDPALEPHAFLVTRWSGEIANCAPEEHDGLGWFNAAELADLVLADPAYLPTLRGLLAR